MSDHMAAAAAAERDELAAAAAAAEEAETVRAARIAAAIVDRLGQGFTVPGWAWEAMARAMPPGCTNNVRLNWGSTSDDVLMRFTMFDGRAELELTVNGVSSHGVAWRGTLRPG